jgi:hypothetical protein
VFDWFRRRRERQREAEARSLAIAGEMDRTRAEMETAGPALISRDIPAMDGGRPVTVSLSIDSDGQFVTRMDMGPGQVGHHRGTPPIATTVSDAQHWALAGRREDADEVAVLTGRGEQVEVLYGDRAWLAIIEPFEEDLPVEVRMSGGGSRTITLPRFESQLTAKQGRWPFRGETAVGAIAGWAWFDPE